MLPSRCCILAQNIPNQWKKFLAWKNGGKPEEAVRLRWEKWSFWIDPGKGCYWTKIGQGGRVVGNAEGTIKTVVYIGIREYIERILREIYGNTRKWTI